jgi:hypothetical protein
LLVLQSNDTWDTATEKTLSVALAAESAGIPVEQHGPWKGYRLVAQTRLPVTFAFKTALGSMGLLQLTEFMDHLRGTKIRYKRLQAGEATSHSPTALDHARRGSSETATGKPGEYKVTLPNGVTVELLGVCEHPSQGKMWWRPDGTPLEESPYDDDFGRAFPNEGEKGYKFAIQFSGLAGKEMDLSIVPSGSKSTNGNGREALSNPSEKNGKKNAKYLDSSIDECIVWQGAALDEDRESCDITIGICYGDWKEQYRYETDKPGDAVEWALFRDVPLRPGIERVLANGKERSAHGFIDLETGMVFENPNLPSEAEQWAWARDHGIDAQAYVDENDSSTAGLHGLDLQVAALQGRSLEEVTVSDVNRALDQGGAAIARPASQEPFVRQVMPWEIGKAYAFRTREGGLGVLLFVETKGGEMGISIRYRLLAAKASGRLQVRLSTYSRNPNLAELFHLPKGHPAGDLFWVDRVVWLDERQVTKAEVMPDGAGRQNISLTLNPLGSARIETMTRTREGRYLAVVFDGKLVAAIRTPPTRGPRLVIGGISPDVEAQAIVGGLAPEH